MHIFVRTNRVLVVETAADATVESVKRAVELRAGLPCAEQRLVYAGKQLEDGRTLVECGVSRDSTVHLVLRLLGGKGGFGALLRSGARASHTQNFDACRDLSGRRLRHVTADEKLAEWASEAKDRELEKIALQHIKEQDRTARREARVQVEVEEVREEHQQRLTTVLTAMHEALAASDNGALVPADGLGPVQTRGAKRSGSSDSTDSPSPPAKRRNRGFLPAAFDELSSDSDDDDTGNDAQAAATLAAAAHGSEAAAEPDNGGRAAGPITAAKELPPAAGELAPQQEASARAAARTLGSRAGEEQPAEPRDTEHALAMATGNNNVGSEMTTAAGPERQASVSGPRGSFVAGVRQASMALSATAPQGASPFGAAAVPPAAASAAAVGSAAGAQRESSGAESNGMTAASAVVAVADIDVDAVGSVEELEACGLDALKAALQTRGLKAGGSAKERATRLWLLKTMSLKQLDRKHFAKPK